MVTTSAVLEHGHADLDMAFRAGKLFAMVGEEGRNPAYPFLNADTLLRVSLDRAAVIHCPSGADFKLMARDRLLRPATFLRLDMDHIFMEAVNLLALDMDYRDLIANAYAEQDG